VTDIHTISTHVLDTTLGKPAAGIPVVLQGSGPNGVVTEAGRGVTDTDGRVGRLNTEPLPPGEYLLSFLTADYLAANHGTVFYPKVTIDVRLTATRTHFHVPVLLNPFSYSTYLGS
jgi:5-hydroxyisourate hydrolase